MCDQHDIAHPPEKIIRRQVRQMRFAISCGHQRFLTDDYPATCDVSMIPRHKFTQKKACVTLSMGVIPEEFFEHLNGSMLYHTICSWVYH